MAEISCYFTTYLQELAALRKTSLNALGLKYGPSMLNHSIQGEGVGMRMREKDCRS